MGVRADGLTCRMAHSSRREGARKLAQDRGSAGRAISPWAARLPTACLYGECTAPLAGLPPSSVEIVKVPGTCAVRFAWASRSSAKETLSAVFFHGASKHEPKSRPSPTACGVLNQQCWVTVRAAVAALQCEGGSGSRSGPRQCERGFARGICVNTQKMRDGPR